jgi:hypothetical protein
MQTIYVKPKYLNHLPDIKITLPSLYDEPHISWNVKCSIFYGNNRKLCNFIIFIVICIIIVTIILLTRNISPTKNESPCISYQSEDYASSVTIECFRYLWKNSGCNNNVPDNYRGWYLRSPNGGKTILCIPPNTGDLCGAGSYKTILTTIYTCNLEYRGN